MVTSGLEYGKERTAAAQRRSRVGSRKSVRCEEPRPGTSNRRPRTARGGEDERVRFASLVTRRPLQTGRWLSHISTL